MKYFVVSDLHGNAEALSELIKHWNEYEEKLLFIGDLNSRGPKSVLIMKMIMDLVKKEKAIWIKGNHEVMLDEFLYEPQIYKSYISGSVGGMKTLENFVEELLNKGYSVEELGDLDNLVKIINEEYSDLVDFISKLPLLHLDKELLFVHAAVNCDTESLSELDSRSLLWGDKSFYKKIPHKFPYKVIFGHMPTQNLGAKGGVYISPCKMKIGIDGGGFLIEDFASVNGVKVDSQNPFELEVFRYYTNKKLLEIFRIAL